MGFDEGAQNKMVFDEVIDSLGMTLTELIAGIISIIVITIALIVIVLVLWNFYVFYRKVTGKKTILDYNPDDDEEDY